MMKKDAQQHGMVGEYLGGTWANLLPSASLWTIAWAEGFKIHFRAHDVLDHLTSETPQASLSKGKDTEFITPELWARHDAIVIQWIYATFSLDLMNTIMEPDAAAKKTWDRLKSMFHDNKHSRALTLENQFVNTKLDNFHNMSTYCQELKMIADQLADVDSKVEPHRLVLQLVIGLNDNYAQIRTHINQMDKLPTFYDAWSKLILEESLRNCQATMSSSNKNSTALISTPENQENRTQGLSDRDNTAYN
ncbi:uncharacterized protein [Rutidosis leptorrhynchoides]|uniref:uncharacterized protein n=1 Tax=Rutidosis leptorrhynchoides TaxID=125765 RepID=UPI003A99E4B8